MIARERNNARAYGGWIRILLFALALLPLTAVRALAEDCVADRGGVIDGFVDPVPPAQIQIDGNCTIRNFPASNPLSSNISFYTSPGQNEERWLVIFDNVEHTGQMSCNSVLGHHIWFTNVSSSGVHANCQNLFIPVEKIDKRNPPGPPTATIGVPFTYSLRIPVLYDPASGTVTDSSGSPNDLHGITVWDDLNATGADLSYVSHVAYWLNSGAPVPHTFSNVGGLLTFDNFPIVPAGEQIVIEITVVLNDTPANAPGTQFINTAKWDFGRLIDDVYYEPLPGEWGVTPPMTIAAPQPIVTKSGPATMNLGQWGDFTIDVHNTGLSDAWNVSLRDLLPDGATGGMCDLTPDILSAQVFEADSVTPVPGKGPLAQGTDYSLSYSGAPNCQLDISMLTDTGTIGPDERLIIRYRTQLDANTQNGVALTNVAGAIQWFNGASSNSNRQSSTRTLTNGTVGTADHEDAHTVTTALSGYFFEKTVANLTSGADPATTANPGDTLRYTLRFRTTDQALSNFSIHDEMDALNAQAAFAPGTLTLGTYPAGADISGTSSTGGSKGTGVIDIGNLNLSAASEAVIQFDITLASNLSNGMVVTNQSAASLSSGTVLSDDPNVNGTADPDVDGDEDPTSVTIVSAPIFVIQKISTDLSGDPNILLPGETLRYTITVKNTGNVDAANVTLRDAVPANTTYVAASTTLNGTPVADAGGLSPLANGMLIHSPADATAGFMPADPSSNPANVATITFDVVVDLNVANGTVISNQGFVSAPDSGIVDQPSDDPDTPAVNDPTLDTVTVFAPELVVTKSGPATMNLGEWGDFTIDVHNTGLSDAWNVSLRDLLPDGATGGMCDLTPNILSARVFDVDGITPVQGKGPLTQGTDYSLNYSAAPNCQLDISVLTDAGTIGPDERLIIRYQAQLDTNTQNGVALTNVAGAIQWFNGDSSNINRQASTRTLTNGTVGTADHEDAHTVTAELSGYFFEKSVANLTSGADPATTAGPGDRLRYTLRLQTTDQALSNFSIHDEMDALNSAPAFVPGTLTLVSYPAGADISGTSSTGGSKGTGVIDIGNLSLPAASEIVIQFDITLASNLINGTVVTNQSAASLNSGTVLSDDPNVNGTSDPTIQGDEDPTRVTIVSAPDFMVQKTSTDLTGDPNILLPGETLRYTITVKNVGNVDSLNVTLRDAVPANTTYVAASTTLNGTPVADVGGQSPLVNGMLINSPVDSTPGSMPADPSSSSTNVATITFDVVVDLNVADGTVISNQGFVTDSDNAIIDQPSDDPDTPTADDPTLDIVTVLPKPVFVVQKISTDLTGDSNVLLAGDTLRYAITVKNIGNQAAANVTLRDAVPANTTYVAGSTTLNGGSVGDAGGQSPLVNGMLINSPSDSTPGSMPADPSSSPANVATITFDVVVDPNVVNGTVISNQGFVTASDSGIIDKPSDDPDTPIADDPTMDIVGNLPLLYAEKRVTLSVDQGSPGVVDPGDVLQYTITVQNSGAIPATGVILRDTVPANTTYVADSTSLNGLPVGQPDGGVPPLASGIDSSSSDLTPPLPGSGAGTVSPKATAVLQFSLRVDPGTPAGTVISNQAVASSVELPDLLTDGDGDPATGPEPTVVVVGDGQQLSITKQVLVVGGGAAVAGAQLEYVVRVVNIAAVPASNVIVTDNLDSAQPGQLAYVNGSATLNEATPGISFAGSTITADYGAISGPLEPGEAVVLRFRAILDSNLAAGMVVTNTGVVAWNNPTQTASASVSITVGGVPGFAALNGSAWHDANFDDVRDSGERALAGWTVELYGDGQLLHSGLTDAAGDYRISGVVANDGTSSRYELRFRAPGAGPNTAMLGLADSPFTNGLQQITDIIVPSGGDLQGLNLPIQPNGVIYDSVSRTPIAGATVTLLNTGSASRLPANCFDDAAQQGQVTLADGYYKFDINFSDPSCPSGGDYLITVTAPPGSTYIAGNSQIIPPTSDASTTVFSVPACPGTSADAIPATALFCEVQPSESAPAVSVAPGSAGTIHYLHLTLDSSQSPGSSQIFNNHIPMDPQLLGSVTISKTTPLLNVTRGQLVPYVITVNNVAGQLLTDVSIVDRFPAGFTYVEGSALLDGSSVEPSVAGLELNWNGLTITGTGVRTLKLLLVVGGGVTEGEYVNHAQVINGATGGAMSGEATATVRVIPDPTFDCTDVTGKVFKDVNRNRIQDQGEEGLPGVRVVTPTGLQATTDQYGRYHITCAVTPNESRGSNFVLKLDDRTLPSGFRMSTNQMQIQRATSGKALQINFGASIYRVVGIDLSDAVFEPGTTEIRVQWRPRLDLLLEELHKAPSVLRLSYIADTEDAALVDRRMEAVKRQLTEAWDAANDSYGLTIEPEVFWRRGAPAKRSDVRVPKSR